MSPRVAVLIALFAALTGCVAPSVDTAERRGSDAALAATVPVTSPVSTSSPRCTTAELTLFACALTNGKSVALCASPDATETSGYVRYAYGVGDTAELSVPTPISAAGDRFRSTRVLFPSGNGRHAYSFENGGYRYVAYQSWETRDGHAARGGLIVLDSAGAAVLRQDCISLNDAEQVALAEAPFAMPEDPSLGESTSVNFSAAKD